MDNTVKEEFLNRVIDEGIRVEERKQMLEGVCSDEGQKHLKQRLDDAQRQLNKAEKELRDLISRS
jgi:ABC-type phosphate transport system auxiliary subunit